MSQYTPGPWYCTNEDDSVLGQVSSQPIGYQLGGNIALTFGDDAKANARLIAAAPELLEALLDLMPVVNRIMYLSNGTWDLDDEEAVQQARALLARLEGVSE